MPTFDRPLLLALAILLPLAAVWLVLAAQRSRRARLARLGTDDMVSRLVPQHAVRPVGWRAARLAAASMLCGVAASGPRWGMERTVVRGEGVDIVLAVDASLSMLATDERPSRLERAKQEIRRLRAASRGDRFALLAFAGRSYILTPLTIDDGALELFLDNLDPSVVGQAGSSLARTIRQGVDLLAAGRVAGDRALVVFSDGEAFEEAEEVMAAAQLARENGVSLVTVGFGTPAGSTIPIREGQNVVMKRDENGEVVTTRYVPDLLRSAAQAAGGVFVDAAETDKAALVRQALQRLQGVARTMASDRVKTPRYQLFLIPGVLLLLLDTFLSERRGRVRTRRPAAARAAAAALVLALLPVEAARADGAADAAREYRAKRYARAAALYRQAIAEGDVRPRTLYNYGTALLAADSLDAAVEPLERAAKAEDAELRFRATFNLGLVHLKRGLSTPQGDEAALDAAIEVYKRALLMRSTDRDAKWNYELALRKKDESGGGGGGGSSNESPAGGSPQPDPQQQQSQRPSGGIGQQQAEQLLNSAAREEAGVQGRKQRQTRPTPPPGGKDW